MTLSAARIVRRWLLAYETKSGKDIELSLGPPKADDRGWVVQTAHATVGGSPAGYLKFAYIPGNVAKRLYPTVLHYVVRIRGESVTGDVGSPEGARRAMLEILGISPSDPITTRKLTNLFNKKFGPGYERFIDFHVDKPQVEYVKAEALRQGVGISLYEFVARELAKRGLSLWASTIQQPEAKAVWAAMVARGYPVRMVSSKWDNPRMTLGY